MQTLETEQANQEFIIFSIAGNDKITLTYRDKVDADPVEKTELVIRDSEITNYSEDTPQYVDRLTVMAQVQDLPHIYKTLRAQGINIDHFYDY